jgi:uncharacterized iron-regulated protein
MLPRILLQFLLGLPLLLALTANPATAHIYDIGTGGYVSFPDMIEDLKTVRLVFMGEMHDNAGHHRAQLQVIQALHEAGVPVAIGLEMFRRDSQAALDRWTAGDLAEGPFVRVFLNNWSMWPVYREIFQYARQRHIPLVGLNITREITQQVARSGFGSLSAEQRGELPLVRCDVDPRYQEYLLRTLGSHAHNGAAFRNFCEAQLVWDAVMAKNLIDYQGRHPDRVIVILAGSGHAWKFGIPEQVLRHGLVPYRVLLPGIPGRIEPANTTRQEADYLLLGTEEGPLH